jgi:hypothetical protein
MGLSNTVRALRGRSIDHMPRLIDDKALFDLIFVDGSHETIDVMVDACLAWRTPQLN